jgi:hypothetical protein
MVATVFLLASTISGLSRTLDKAWPAPTMINGPQETLPMGAITLAAAEAARALPSGSRIAAAECRQIDGEAWWQFILQAPQPIPCPPGQFGPPLLVQPEPVYVHAQTGVVAPPGFDEVYAKELAATVLGTPGQLDQHLLGFSPQYAVIHRLRPVYQISGADGSSQTAFVSTHAGAVSEWLDVRRKIDKAFFSLFHKYFFVRDRTVREAFQVGVNCLMLAMAGSGLWLWWRLRHLPPGPRTVRRLHRRVGLVAFLAVALGAGSGVLHTTMIFLADAPPPPRPALPPPVTEATAVPPVPAGTVALAVVAVDETAVYQARFAGSPVPEYFDAMYGKVIDGGERQLARSIAEQALGPDPIWLKRKHAFDVDYGRINKFLPVSAWRAAAPGAGKEGDNDREVHVSTVTGSITRSTTGWDRAQIRLFNWLHSLSWLPEPVRTVVLVLLAASIFVTTGLGIVLFFPRIFRRRSPSNASPVD